MDNVGIFYDHFGILYSHLEYCTAIWNIIGHLEYYWPFGIFYGRLVRFVLIWYIFPALVFLDQKNLATLPRSSNDNAGKKHISQGSMFWLPFGDFDLPIYLKKVCLQAQSFHYLFELSYRDEFCQNLSISIC
jgi:hypothetical protein